jgi:hypothetical protein
VIASSLEQIGQVEMTSRDTGVDASSASRAAGNQRPAPAYLGSLARDDFHYASRYFYLSSLHYQFEISDRENGRTPR